MKLYITEFVCDSCGMSKEQNQTWEEAIKKYKCICGERMRLNNIKLDVSRAFFLNLKPEQVWVK